MPAEFHFLRPEWLWALPAVVAGTLLLAYRKLGPGSWQNVVAPELAPHVLSRSAARAADSRWWLLGIGGVLATLALAGPAWQRIDQPVFRSDQALVIALDLSRSMDAQDMTPSRLMRARLKILDILERRGGGQTAEVGAQGLHLAHGNVRAVTRELQGDGAAHDSRSDDGVIVHCVRRY